MQDSSSCRDNEEQIQAKPLAGHITPLVQRQTEDEEEEEAQLQTKAAPAQKPQVSPIIGADIQAMRGSGQPLAPATRTFMEPRFGHDFNRVRVHTGTKAANTAQSINARAFTLGHDMFFGTGQYAPATSEGRRLLAHELTHVIQQNDSSPSAVVQRWKAKSSDSCLTDSIARAKSLLTGKLTDAEKAYGKWGCKTDEFMDDGKGPELEVKFGGTQCAVSWKNSTGQDLISINPAYVDCCSSCKDRDAVVKTIAHTIIHETAHWCAGTHGIEIPGVEEGDDVETTLFGGMTILDDCVAKTVSSYGDKPCFSCPYLVKKGDNLWKIAEKFYSDGSKWKLIYDANRELIGDEPDLIHPNTLLKIPPIEVSR